MQIRDFSNVSSGDKRQVSEWDDQLKGVKVLYFGHVRLNDFYLGHETIFIVHKQIIKPSTGGRPDKDFSYCECISDPIRNIPIDF